MDPLRFIWKRDWQTMKNLLNVALLALLVGLMAACGASEREPAAAPTMAPTTGVEQAVEPESDVAVEAGTDLSAGIDDGETATRCTEVDPHPMGVSIAEKFDVSYERVMTWFCSGHAFDEILIALQTSGMSDASVEELLTLRQSQPWDQIWVELGVVGP